MFYYMKVWNQFILLVANLAFCQLIFDLMALLNICDPKTNKTCYNISAFFGFYMPVSATLWTNVIVTVLYSSIVYFKPNVFSDNFMKIFGSIHIFGLIIAILDS